MSESTIEALERFPRMRLPHVLRVRDVLQIRKAIVEPVAVLVVDLQTFGPTDDHVMHSNATAI
jgi:hypothetical protein